MSWPPAPKVIETVRLILRPVIPSEARALLAAEPVAGLRPAEGFPSEGVLESMDLFVGPRRTELPGFTPFHLIGRSDRLTVGGIGFTPIPGSRSVTVGYGVSAAVEGHGYATEALVGLIDWLLAAGAETVRADTYADHVASRRVMEKAGMQLTEEIDAAEDGKPVRYVNYAISRR